MPQRRLGGGVMVQRTKGNGPYAPLSATYYRDDAILEVGPDAEVLFVRGLAYCAEALSDGFISDRQLRLVVGVGIRDSVKRAQRLVDVGLWESVEGGYVVRSWLKWNKSAEDIGRHKKNDRERKANKAQSGIQEDSARNPNGIPEDSSPQSTTQHNTTQQELLAAEEPAAKKPRPADPIWDAVMAACGIKSSEITKTARGGYGRAISELKAVGATPAQIALRSRRWSSVFPGATLTPNALAKHWSQLENGGSSANDAPGYWRKTS